MPVNGLYRFIFKAFFCIFNFFFILAHNANAGEFTSRKFLTWKESSQNFYIEACVGMAAFIAAQIDSKSKQAQCISKWYYPAETEKNGFIKKVMRKNDTFHPRAIILGVLEKQCGEF